MTFLVGQQGTGWTTVDQTPSGSTQVWFVSGYAVAAAGTVTSANAYVSNWNSSPRHLIVSAYDSGGNLLGNATTMDDSQGNGLVNAPMTLSRALVLSEIIFVTWCQESYITGHSYSGAPTFQSFKIDNQYPTPPSTLAGASGDAGSEFVIWLDGTTGGGASILLGQACL